MTDQVFVYEIEVSYRADKLEALVTAKEIFVEATSFAQTRSFLQVSSSKSNKVIHMLKTLASEETSKCLARLASRVASAIRIDTSSGEDLFVKIKAMVNDMITSSRAHKLRKPPGRPLAIRMRSSCSRCAWCQCQLHASSSHKQGHACPCARHAQGCQ